MNCEHKNIVMTISIRKEIGSIVCKDCGYIFSIPEFRKGNYKSIVINER